MPVINKLKNTLGSVVVSYLSQNLNNKFSNKKQDLKNDYYVLFKDAIKKVVFKVVSQLGLKSVITENQIESASSDLLNEIVLTPSKFDIILDEIKSSRDFDEKTKNEKIVKTKTSKHVSSKIREIVQLEEKPAPLIHSYLSKRAVTLLKQYAEGNSKKYILLNNNIKKAISSLKEANIIYEPIKGRFASTLKSTALFNPKKCTIMTNNELEAESKKVKHNLKKYILAFLRANCFYNFSTRDFTEYAFSMFYDEKRQEQTAKITNGNDKSDNFTIEAVSLSDASAEIMAKEAINILIKQSSNTRVYIQSEMASLAYLYRTVPQYFNSAILTNEQLEFEETKCIEYFLNDQRFSNFNKSKIGRTTAFYRKNLGIDRIKSSLLDLSAEAQGIFIKLCCSYLENKYKKLIGETK